MKRRLLTYFLFLGLIFSLSSCTEEVLSPESGKEDMDDGNLQDVYALNFIVTLDNMGSGIETRATGIYNPSSDPQKIKDAENYIDPERFRVLFFDHNNIFIFESKNRWVKKVDENDYYSSWYVSVPLGPFGNDSYGIGREYDWDDIHTKLTTGSFKIAILANRPHELQYPGFTESTLDLPDGVFKNDGPVWGPEDSGKKSLLDLHHCQYDIIYTDKGNHLGGNGSFPSNAFYDFVMGDIFTNRPTMGAAIHWASFDYGDTDKELLYQDPNKPTSQTWMRNVKMPSKDHPIPMYGIQEFEPIPTEYWKPGTAFDISNTPEDAFPDSKYTTNSISLLRACVRLDLKIPKSVKSGKRPSLITLWYSNIYSRCEPMDTWTNTSDLWKEHDNGCEWEKILNHKLLIDDNVPSGTTTKDAYQKKIAWFYGAWTDPDLGQYAWKFNRIDNKTMTPKDAGVAETDNWNYPRIFNPCIQRNKVIKLDYADVSDLYNDNYWHYVVYTGERNMNDPNNIYELRKNPYIASFVITWDKTNYYCVPLLQYGKNNSTKVADIFGPHTGDMYANGSWPTKMNTFIHTDMPAETNKNNWPYPLLRNHIYSFTLKGTKSGSDIDDMSIISDVARTPDIDYSNKVKKTNLSVKTPVFKVNEKKELIVK